MTDNNELNGLGGWLILVGIGVVIAPIRMIISLVPVYQPVFEDGTWAALTTAGSEFYTPYLGTLLMSEILFNALLFIASIYLIYLFFARHYLFPKVYIAISVIALVFIPINASLVTKLFPGEPMFDPVTVRDFGRAFFGCMIWVPYMLLSERVKLTFVEGYRNKTLTQPAEGIG